MIKELISYFNKSKSRHFWGAIRLVVESCLENDLSFRLDGDHMSVNWGDGMESETLEITGLFIHHYTNNGTYTILIQGKNITVIDMPDCHCIQLDISECGTLEFINCTNNRLTKLDVSHCQLLYELHCNNNYLERLNVSGLGKLFYLACSFNKLKSLDVQGCRDLVNLYCCRNDIKALDLRQCRKLVVVKAEENAFDEAALLNLVSTLRYKFNHTVGLVGVGRMFSGYTERVRVSIVEKGWSEI